MARKLFEDDTEPKGTSEARARSQTSQPPAPNTSAAVPPRSTQIPPTGGGRLPPKPPVSQSKPVRSGGRRWAHWLLILFLLLVIGFLFVLLNYRPELVGLMRIADWRSTNAAVIATVGVLDSTNVAQQQRDANLLNTQVSLDNYSALLGQTETQQAVNNFSTMTAVAAVNAQQATRAAEDFTATQSALQQLSTQVQQEFESTQAAISGNLATIAANQPPQNILILDGDFVRGSESINNASPSPVWAASDSGALIAQTANATVLTRRTSYPEALMVNVGIVTAGNSAYYDVLLGISESTTGTIIRIYHDGTKVTNAALFNVAFRDLTQTDGILVNDAQALATASSLNLDGRDIAVEARIEGQNLQVEINGTTAFETQTPTPLSQGAIGVQLRSNAQLQVLQVLPGVF